ncbi:MAG: histidine kinase, partial [Bacteroidota bacterium]
MAEDNKVWISTRRQVFFGEKDGQIQEVTGALPTAFQRRLEINSITAQGDGAWVVASENLFWIEVSPNQISGQLMQIGSPDFIFLNSEDHFKFKRTTGPYLDTYHELDCIHRMQIGDGSKSLIIHATVEYDDGIVWCASHEGLYRGAKDVAEKYEFNHLLPSVEVNDLLKTGDSLWVATEGGIALILEGEIVRTWVPEGESGMPRFRKLALDRQGRMWMASPNGLYCLIRGEFYRFSMAQGLPAKDVNHVMVDDDQTLWISTSLGIAQLDLNQPLPLADPPNIFWKNLRVNDQSWSFEQLSRLKASARLQIDLGCLSLLHADEISWQMRVKEDDPWQNITSKTITLSNLQPGSYSLQVRARLPHSSWQELSSLTWVIMHPWYQRPGLVSLLALGLMAIGVGWVYLRQVQKRQALAEKMEIQQQMAVLELKGLQAQLNPHFIFNALNAIQHSIVTQDVISTNHYLTRFAHLLRRFLEASRVRKHSLQVEVELLDQYLELEALCYEDRFEYEIKTAPSVDPERQMVPVMLLQPLVENAVRHGLLGRPSRGLLRVRFLKLFGRLVAVVEDNGVGLASQPKLSASSYPSRGLEIIRARIDTHNRA